MVVKQVKTRRLERLYLSELEGLIAESPIAYFGLGLIEWHAEHLPLGVDCTKLDSLLELSAVRTGGVIVPTTAVGTYGYRSFTGSIVYSQQLTEDYFVETLLELHKMGFKLIVMPMGHAGEFQEACIEKAMERTRQLAPIKLWAFRPGMLLDPQRGGHANQWETLCALSSIPEWVDISRELKEIKLYSTLDTMPEFTKQWKNFTTDNFTFDFSDLPSPEEAYQLMDQIAEKVAEHVVRFMEGELPPVKVLPDR